MAAGFMKVKAGEEQRIPETPLFAAGAVFPPFGLLEGKRLREGLGPRRKPDPILCATFRRRHVTHARRRPR